MKPDRNACVAVIQAGEATLRPALFAYMTRTGFAWVEPAYLEPAPTRLAMHGVEGVITANASGFTCEGNDGRSYIVGAVADMQEGTGADLRKVLEWARAEIEAAGSTLDAERDRIRQFLGDQVA